MARLADAAGRDRALIEHEGEEAYKDRQWPAFDGRTHFSTITTKGRERLSQANTYLIERPEHEQDAEPGRVCSAAYPCWRCKDPSKQPARVKTGAQW